MESSKLTEYHRKNMRKHIAFLEENAEEIRESFNMRDLLHECGTPSCSLGYATLSIEIPITRDTCNSVLKQICKDYFGFDWFSREWDYVFSMYWADVNNTPEAAAARMKAVLYNQEPERWAYTDEFAHPIVIEEEILNLERV